MQRLALVLLAVLALAVGGVLFARSRIAAVETFAWRDGFPHRLLYESAPTTLFPTARTTALGQTVDVDYGNGMSIRVEITTSPETAAAIARRWYDGERAAATSARESAAGFELTSSAAPPSHARIVVVGEAAVRTTGTHPDDRARLLTWIPGLQRGEIEDPIAVLRRDRPTLFWALLTLTACVAAIASWRARHAVPRSR
ncbi:MAG: hypothetical protein IPH13_04095 [Planctomycetes bacterium]|nr:hypothetical protein [Planctomycetota bacterium]MCC7170721.1 hypothetical protein [Planctomycetota bacterium]